MRQAAEQLRQGNKAEAQRLMRQNLVTFGEAGKVAGLGAIDRDVEEQRQMLDSLDEANDGDAVNAWSKDSRRKARVNFGLMGSTY